MARTITSIISTAESGVAAVDGALAKTQDFLGSLGSDKYGGELLPTVISMRELIESFDKKSGQLIAETRKMLGDVSAVRQQGRPEIWRTAAPALSLPPQQQPRKWNARRARQIRGLTAPPTTVTRPESTVPRALQTLSLARRFRADRAAPDSEIPLRLHLRRRRDRRRAARQPQGLRRIRLRAARAQRRLRPRPDHDAVRQDLCLAVRHSADGLFGAVRLSRRHRADAGGEGRRTCR